MIVPSHWRDTAVSGDGAEHKSGYTIVIPSKTMSKLEGCLRAIRLCACRARIHVIWDGPALTNDDLQVLKGASPVSVFHGPKPFVYARNVNIGIREAMKRDYRGVILLNDDAILMTGGGFDLLAAAGAHAEYGVMSAAILGDAAAAEQCLTRSLRDAGIAQGRTIPVKVHHHMVAFIAVYIRTEVFWRLGLLDERFIGYGYDDDDYCRRVLQEGLKLGVVPGCIVEHGTVESTYRGAGAAGGDMLAQNRELFEQKWGKP